MAEDVQRDLRLTRAEKEKEKEAQAGAELYDDWPLPKNINSMKDFAFGKFTWRDVAFICASELIPIVIMLPFQMVIPQWLCLVIGAVLGLPFAFLSIKHIFTGDLPFEERLKIALNERGESNLLNWDKTKQNGEYVDSSTQSFVPVVEFDEDDFIMLPNNQGGFAVVEISVDDMSQAKNSERLSTVKSFKRLLDALINDSDCTPIQILLKSVPKNLAPYIEKADDDCYRIETENKHVAHYRAEDYKYYLQAIDKEIEYYYNYYVVVTYRADAEDVGKDSMKSASVRRMELREKGNPLQKRAEIAAETDYEIGEDRKAKNRELAKDNRFGRKRTKVALERRVNIVMNMMKDLGSTHTDVKPRLLGKQEVAKLIFQCYNDTDKNTIDDILEQALEERNTIYSKKMYEDFPEIFDPKTIEPRRETDKTLDVQKRGHLGKVKAI